MKKKFLVILIFILITVVMVISGTLKEAEDLFWDGQYDRALVEFKSIAADSSRNVDERCMAYMFIADIYQINGDTKSWEGNLIKVLLLNENYVPDPVKFSKESQEKLKKLKSGDTLKKIKVIIKKYNMVKIPAGSFMMGSPSGEYDSGECPRHKVYLDEYYISKYEVTFDEYDRFCDATGKKKPSDCGWGRGRRPVIDVTWYDAVAYCEWLSKETGLNFRLPTEAEWEYACRGGTTTKYSFGDDASQLYKYGNYRDRKCYYRYKDTSYSVVYYQTSPVGSFLPNSFGIYDMHGNVWEWCSDWYGKDYYSSSPDRNPEGPSMDSFRVYRGGSWRFSAVVALRSANRNGCRPDGSNIDIGFRPVMTFEFLAFLHF